ncbi:MAG: type II toxin-antitoxin system prevent-host-death family antitoxin [Candidatus Saccharibacteria bacterium]|nr:type II toxin-antitoxin system prevent-host-death family antitoxin [Candidatus Saccharibacteria bacterium]
MKKYIETNKNTEEIGFRELRNNADSVIRNVGKGKSYVVKRHSKPLFRIVPMDEPVWNTVVDFTELSPEGVGIEEVLESIDQLKAEKPKKYGGQNKKISG